MSRYRVFKDGTKYCAVGPHFKNLQASPAGFGDTIEEAVAQLIADPSHQTWLRRINGAPPQLSEFAQPPYPFCRTPLECCGKGHCPKEYACND